MSNTPIRIGQPDNSQALDICGCCEGIALSTSQKLENRPHLSSIQYRVGNHAQFKASMLAALNSSKYGALNTLGTRDEDDFSIALIDAWASVCEVLSFYQERNANEAYMETATERLSIGEIARLIGYRLHPGAAAEVDLVLTMQDPPGGEADVMESTIPTGTRVQSQPGPDETPQTFETVTDLPVRVSWNNLTARQDKYRAPRAGDTGIWLAGQATGLVIGDTILIISPQRYNTALPDFDMHTSLWAMRRVIEVEPDKDLNRTRITWDKSLGSISTPGMSDEAGHKFFVLKDRASLFGFNAPHPKVFSSEQLTNFGFSTPPSDWTFNVQSAQKRLNLDIVYKGFVRNGWAVTTKPGSINRLYRITNVTDDGQSLYAISGRSTEITVDTNSGLSTLASAYRSISVYGSSQELDIAEAPINTWVSGNEVILDRQVEFPKDKKLIVQGRRAQVTSHASVLPLRSKDGETRFITRGARLSIQSEPKPFFMGIKWVLRDADGFVGTVITLPGAFGFVPASDKDEEIAENAFVENMLPVDPEHSKLVFKEALSSVYDRKTFQIFGNIATASHGEGTSEILGSGNPATPFQKFLLKQNPVTQRLAATESGIKSTLSVRVDGVEWTEKPDLYARSATDRIYTTILTDGGHTIIQFGDGRSGANLQPGRDNIVAEYRRGLGKAGNVRKGQLSLLLDRPLGLTEAINPLPASGGDDPETSTDARRNAPIYTLTLGRVVSITDYRDFALGFPGISKADSRWIWSGVNRRIIVTVAGLDGEALTLDGPTLPALLAAYKNLGDPLVMVDTVSYQPTHFKLAMKVSVDLSYVKEDILIAIEEALRKYFSFENREFTEKIALSKIASIAHTVAGVQAVDIDSLYRESGPQSNAIAHPSLMARTSRLDTDGTFLPAEILTLSPVPFDALVVMS